MGASNDDSHARDLWGGAAYDKIPKSVFATLAWHLANVASAEADSPLAAENRALEELQALESHMGAGQALRAMRALAAVSYPGESLDIVMERLDEY